MFLKSEKLVGSLSFYQSEFSEQGQRGFLFQDFDGGSQGGNHDYDGDGIPNKDDNDKYKHASEAEVKTYLDKQDKRPSEIKIADIEAKAKVDVAEMNRYTKLDIKELDKEIAKISVEGDIKVAREINDPNEISVDEFKAIDVITKNNLVGEGLENFIKAVGNKNPDAIKDLQSLQKALKADGKYKGKIDEDFGEGTKAGMNALISENAPAIKVYYETKQLLQENSSKAVTPKDTPIEKEISTEIEY